MQGNGSFRILCRATMPQWAVDLAGAPVEVWLDIQSSAESEDLLYDVFWVNKTATRLPEVCSEVNPQDLHGYKQKQHVTVAWCSNFYK